MYVRLRLFEQSGGRRPTPSQKSVSLRAVLGSKVLAAVSTTRSKLLERPRHEEDPRKKDCEI